MPPVVMNRQWNYYYTWSWFDIFTYSSFSKPSLPGRPMLRNILTTLTFTFHIVKLNVMNDILINVRVTLNLVHSAKIKKQFQIIKSCQQCWLKSTASDDIPLTGPPWLELGALCGERQEQGHCQGGPGHHAHGDQDDHEIFCVSLLGGLCELDT